MASPRLLLFVALAVAAPARVAAAAGPCDCDHVIDPSTPSANGADLGVSPGDSVCVAGGQREFLRLYEFVGTEEAPIEIRNCEGVVAIDNDDRGYGLTVDESAFFHITGTGDDAYEYGFTVRAARTGPDYSASGVIVAGLSTDYELDHFEVYETGFAGFNLKTEPRCDGSANLGAFVQRNSRVHHHYIHDTGGEGVYFGSTGYGGREYDCDGVPTLLYPHEHHGVWLHDLRIERTGWDGLQVGVSPMDCHVYNNTIHDVGLEGVEYQTQGIQIGGGSACEIYGNDVRRGPAMGIIILNAQDTEVYNNIFWEIGVDGIYANNNDEFPEASYRFAHNTIGLTGHNGITMFADELSGNIIANNLIVGVAEAPVAYAAGELLEQDNLSFQSPDEVGFVDAAAGDLHLLADAAPVDAAAPLPGFVIDDDLDGVARDAAPDAGALEYTEPDPGTTTGDSDSTTGDSDSTTGDSDGTTGPGTSSSGGDSDGTTAGSDGTSGTGGTSGDAGGTTDGGSDSGGGGEDGDAGCGCRVDERGASGLLLLVALGLVRRRRR
ncbi:MAG: right-handed parallel beta-helix repeat-containing protein [Myxococcales bacterium]|nr:right-handed parallel beta-helix repeat-containing protein [Myxococcales bacterium]